jgi:chromosome partitioning protein
VIGVVVSNQRGGVGKTTTAVNYAGYLMRKGRRVLLIDADSQGSAATILGLKPKRFLSHFIINRERLCECITVIDPNLHILASSRETQQAETALLGQMAREKALKMILEPEVAGNYDAVIVDVAPSVTLLQSCAMLFTEHVLIPVAMDLLSLQGAQMSVETVRLLNEFYGINIRIVGFLPTQVNARLQITATVSATLDALARKTGLCVLPTIRVDQTVHKAAGARKLLFEYDPTCKAAEDYEAAFETITQRLEGAQDGQAQKA